MDNVSLTLYIDYDEYGYFAGRIRGKTPEEVLSAGQRILGATDANTGIITSDKRVIEQLAPTHPDIRFMLWP